MTYEDFIKESIRNYMSDLFYIEGKDSDYFFGKSIWNDDLTLFYNDLDDRTSLLKSAIENAVDCASRDLLKEIDVYYSSKIVDLSRSAFNVYAKSRRYFDEEEKFLFGINVMKVGDLEKAI